MDQYAAFLADRGVTAAERERIINGNIGQLPGSFESSANVLNALRSNALYGRPDSYWEDLAQRYQGLSAEAMDAEARRLIDGSQMVWIIVGDAASVRPQLEDLGLEVEVREAQ